MQVHGAVAHAVGKPWVTETLELTEPGSGEVRVKVMASGVCHSDEHVVTGDSHVTLPHVGGHEGAGIVDAVGPGVTRVRVGDHVVTAFLPACGRCRWCAEGMQYICDDGGESWTGMMLDGTHRFSLTDGTPCGAFQRLGTFANYLVTPQEQCIPVPEDIPFEIACLVSCGVTTGWGAAVNAAAVRPRDTVLVMGIGGVGINAVQGAAHAGAAHVVAVDPVEFKREAALQFGATHAFPSMEAVMPFVRSVTNGQGADSSIVTVGRLDRTLVGDAFRAVRKEGRCAVVSFGVPEKALDINAVELVAYAKTLRGVLFGNARPTTDIPRLLDHYRSGHLRLDELITARYGVDEVAQAYDDMYAGRNLRGVVVHEH